MSIGSRIIERRLLQTLIWNLKFKFMGVVTGQGNAVISIWLIHFFFDLDQFDQFMIYNYLESGFENSRSRTWVKSKLHSSPGIQLLHFLFVMRKLDELFVRYASRVFELIKLEECFEWKENCWQ